MSTEKQPNIENHNQNVFNAMIETAIRENGLHLTASKGFGKTRLLFSIAQHIRTSRGKAIKVSTPVDAGID